MVRLEAEHTKGKARRLVPLNESAYTALVRLRRICDDHFPDTPYVFTHTSPRLLGDRVDSVSKAFQTAIKRAGISYATPHALRHTAITEGVHAPNANVVDISHIAGWCLNSNPLICTDLSDALHRVWVRLMIRNYVKSSA